MTPQTKWRSKVIGVLISALSVVGTGTWWLVQAWAENVNSDSRMFVERLDNVERDVVVLVTEQVHMTAELERVHDTLKEQQKDQREFYRWFYTNFGTREEARKFDQPADDGAE